MHPWTVELESTTLPLSLTSLDIVKIGTSTIEVVKDSKEAWSISVYRLGDRLYIRKG